MEDILEKVLCACSAYEQKYYLNPEFDALPTQIKEDLNVMCVLFTEDVGGIIELVYDENGTLLIKTDASEEDILYDEIGSGLKVRQIQRERRELLESLELYYKVKFLGLKIIFLLIRTACT